MKESSWNDCVECSSAVQISPDNKKAQSLLQIADGRISYLENNKIDENNANYIFEGFYASLVEYIHALACASGYKIINHLCLGFFIRDVLKKEILYRLFDDCRYNRNSLVYYGNRMDFNTAKNSIDKSKRLIKELKNIIVQRLK